MSIRITDASDGLSKGMESLAINSEHVKDEVKDYVRRYCKELKRKEERFLSEVETFYSAEIRLVRLFKQCMRTVN